MFIPIGSSRRLTGRYLIADTLLNTTGLTQDNRPIDFDPTIGNGVLGSILVGNDPITITQFAIYGQQATAGNVHYSIFDGTSAMIVKGRPQTPLTRVYDSGSVPTPQSATAVWNYSPTFNLTLAPNKTYYLGLISDQTYTFNYKLPNPTVDFGLGFSAPAADGSTRGINGNMGTFSNPTFNSTAWAQISFRVYGATPTKTPLMCFLNWAEKNYANLFAPAGAATQVQTPYTYRYYATTNSYLGPLWPITTSNIKGLTVQFKMLGHYLIGFIYQVARSNKLSVESWKHHL